jgi:hypothetical protein
LICFEKFRILFDGGKVNSNCMIFHRPAVVHAPDELTVLVEDLLAADYAHVAASRPDS